MFDKKLYPPYWKQFSEYIRFERAKNKCERCGAANGAIVERGYLDDDRQFPVWSANGNDAYHAATGEYLGCFRFTGLKLNRYSKIVLTVAHLDNRSGVCQCKRFFGFKCARPDHVLALCQSCHLSLDREKHLAARAKNRAARKDAKRRLLENLTISQPR